MRASQDRAIWFQMFIVFFELGAGSQPFKRDGYAGGFVACIVPENELVKAIKEGQRCLLDDGYEIVDIEKAMRFDADDWEEDPQIIDLVKTAQSTNSVQYSGFEVWGH